MTDKTNAIRLQLVKNDYAIIPTHGKVPAVKGWNAADWAARQLTSTAKGSIEHKLERWWARFPGAWSTGVRIERGLVAVDVDVDDEGAAKAIFQAVERIVPDVAARAPCRFGGGQWKLAMFCRLSGEDFVRVGSHKYHRPGEGKDKYHHVEIYGGRTTRSGFCSRQFAVYGPRSYAD